jgi:integrase
MTRLTDLSVSKVQPEAARIELADYIPGLKLVVFPTGAKSFVLRYRLAKRQVKMTIGSYPKVTLAAARDAARAALDKIAVGQDPTAAKRETAIGDGSVGSAVAQYTDKKLPKLAAETQAFTRRELGLMLAAWRGRQLKDITRADVRALIDAADVRGPAAANGAKNRVGAFLTWCVERDLIEVSPAQGMKKPNAATKRDRVLSDAELAAVWKAADRCQPTRYGDAVKLLMLSGCRRSEIYRLEWSEVTADEIVVPATRTKTKAAHSVPITPAMRAILDAQPHDTRFVFGNGGIPSGAYAKTVIDKAMVSAIPAWRVHDLRRSFITGCAELGVDPFVIERAVNHAIPGVMATYQRHQFKPQIRACFEQWSAHVEKITAGPMPLPHGPRGTG